VFTCGKNAQSNEILDSINPLPKNLKYIGGILIRNSILISIVCPVVAAGTDGTFGHSPRVHIEREGLPKKDRCQGRVGCQRVLLAFYLFCKKKL